jgi:ABC-type transport system involved in multi-copper enzyme maturation permease subunit
MPVMIVTPMLLQLFPYFGMGLEPGIDKFFKFYLILFFLALSSAGYGYLISSIFSNPEIAVSIAPIVMLPLILFGGMFSNLGTVGSWISWVQYISPIRYGYEALLRVEFEDKAATLPFDPITQFDLNLGGTECLVALIVLTVVLRLIALFALKFFVGKF